VLFADRILVVDVWMLITITSQAKFAVYFVKCVTKLLAASAMMLIFFREPSIIWKGGEAGAR